MLTSDLFEFAVTAVATDCDAGGCGCDDVTASGLILATAIAPGVYKKNSYIDYKQSVNTISHLLWSLLSSQPTALGAPS